MAMCSCFGGCQFQAKVNKKSSLLKSSLKMIFKNNINTRK